MTWFQVVHSEGVTLKSFAAQYGLKVVVMQRDEGTLRWLEETHRDKYNAMRMRFYAFIEDAEIKDGPILRSDYANGMSEWAALQAYTHKIAGQLLVINAMAPEQRREIRAPFFSGVE